VVKEKAAIMTLMMKVKSDRNQASNRNDEFPSKTADFLAFRNLNASSFDGHDAQKLACLKRVDLIMVDSKQHGSGRRRLSYNISSYYRNFCPV
jgi:hypothetical protein